MRALIVDADVLTALQTLEALTEHGFRSVEMARSSGEGLIRAKASQPDIVIVSVELESNDIGQALATKLEQVFGLQCVLTSTQDDVSKGTLPKADVQAIVHTAWHAAKERRSRRALRERI